jgi:hypothetical protein
LRRVASLKGGNGCWNVVAECGHTARVERPGLRPPDARILYPLREKRSRATGKGRRGHGVIRIDCLSRSAEAAISIDRACERHLAPGAPTHEQKCAHGDDGREPQAGNRQRVGLTRGDCIGDSGRHCGHALIDKRDQGSPGETNLLAMLFELRTKEVHLDYSFWPG